jgi:hypothetical protein
MTAYWGGALYLKITYQNFFFKNRFWKKISDKKDPTDNKTIFFSFFNNAVSTEAIQ